MITDDRTVGEWLKDNREAKGLSLRKLAAQLELSPSYISDIENGNRRVTETLARSITVELGLSFDEAMARAALLGTDVERYLRRNPDAVALVRCIAARRVQPETCEQWLKNINELSAPSQQGDE